MNAAADRSLATASSLHLLALASCAPSSNESGPEAAWLCAQRAALTASGDDFRQEFARWQAAPPPQDTRLIAFARAWTLSTSEVIALAIAGAAETDAMVGRVLAWLQAPVGGGRPTIGLIATIAANLGEPAALAAIAGGTAHASGM